MTISKEWEAVEDALQKIMDRCDGAREQDGQGYSRYDHDDAATLLDLGSSGWDTNDKQRALSFVRKYHRQLSEEGLNSDTLVAAAAAADGNSTVVEMTDDMLASLTSATHGGSSTQLCTAEATPAPVAEVSHASITDVEPAMPQAMPQEQQEFPSLTNLAADPTVEVPCGFLTGSAGTGKTYQIRQRCTADPLFAMVCATTGIAAVNLGTITINSLLHYFDTESMIDAFTKGYIGRRLRDLADDGYRAIVVDELSMMDKVQLGMLYEAVRQVNEYRAIKNQSLLELIVTGDFCQLPPIKAEWAFKADIWPQFEANTTRLTKSWRQTDERFVQALSQIRSGNGDAGVELLRQCGVEFVGGTDSTFDGTTIIAKNEGVDRFNFAAHSRVNGRIVNVESQRWGKQRGEWGNIPPRLQLKIGAYVMILSNDSPGFSYVNGDCGHISDYTEESGIGTEFGDIEGSPEHFSIGLVRTGYTVPIGPITRFNTQKDAPRELGEDNRSLRAQYRYNSKCDPYPQGPAWDVEKQRWIVGGITYYPLRLAYATTVHKSQGLSLDRVQLDTYGHFLGAPNMAYVALSRAKSPAGLRIVGTPELLRSRVKVSPEVLRFL